MICRLSLLFFTKLTLLFREATGLVRKLWLRVHPRVTSAPTMSMKLDSGRDRCAIPLRHNALAPIRKRRPGPSEPCGPCPVSGGLANQSLRLRSPAQKAEGAPGVEFDENYWICAFRREIR